MIITGGSRGIGYATAGLMAQNGWRVSFCGRDAKHVQDAAAHLTSAGWDVHGTVADMGKEEDIKRLFEQTLTRFGRIDALVNNAAVLHTMTFPDFSMEEWEDMMNVNVRGVMLSCREAFRRMQPGGHIVNVSSVAGLAGEGTFPGLWGYAVTKFAVCGITEALSMEGRSHGILVNTVAPGATETEMLQKAAPGIKGVPPVNVARVIAGLCETSQTGTIITVDDNG